MVESSETDSEDDILLLDEELRQNQEKILTQTPAEKKEDILRRFQKLSENHESYGIEGIRLAIDQIQEVVSFYNESLSDLEKNFSKHASPEVVQLIIDAFASSCDLEFHSVSEINEQKIKIENRFQQLLTKKQEIENITQDSSVEKWFFELVKDWKKEKKNYKQIEKELHHFLQKLQEDIHEDGKKREHICEKINVGLFNEAEKKKWNERVNRDSGKELEKTIKLVDKNLDQRAKKIPLLYEQNVTQNLSTPLKAREELRKLRKKFGWGIFEFLEANELWQKLNTIHVLQKQKSKVERDLNKKEKEKKVLAQELTQINQQLEDLTGMPTTATTEVLPTNGSADDYEENSLNDEGQNMEAENEDLELQIQSLKKVQKIIRDYWLPEALQAKAIQKDGSEGIELFENPKSHAWASNGNPRINWLKTHTDSRGKNLWEKYQQLEAQCPYSVPKEEKATDGDFHPRYINLPLSDFDGSKAKTLDSTLNTFMQGPKELIFLSGSFFIDLEEDKNKYASTPAEVLSKLEFKLSELNAQKLQQPKLNRAA